MDTTFVYNIPEIQLLDTITAEVSNFPDQIGLSDEVMCAYDSVLTQLTEANSKTDSIYHLLQQYGIEGWGVEQVVAIIAVPLIISVFAFSLPMILNAIWKMETEYHSRDISRLVGRSWQSIVYIVCIIFNVGLLLFWLFAPHRQTEIIRILPYSTTALIGSALLFYWNVRDLSNAFMLLKHIDRRYKIDYWLTYMPTLFRGWRLRLRKFFDNKDPVAKNAWNTAIGLNDYYVNYRADERYFNRLLALLRIVVSTNDLLLFYSIKESLSAHVNEIKIRSLNRNNYAPIFYKDADAMFRFHRDAIAVVGQSSEPTFQEDIIESVNSIYSHSQIPVEFNNNWILKALVQLNGDTGLKMVRLYLSRVNSMFNYIPSMAIIASVTGVDIEEKKDREFQCRREWRWMKDMHYMFCAYWWAKNEYRFVPEFCPAKTRMFPSNILPVCGADVLYQCISTIDSIDTLSLTFPLGQVFAVTKEYMRDIVLKYTAWLMYYTARRDNHYDRLPLDKSRRECIKNVLTQLDNEATGPFIKHVIEINRFDDTGIDIKSIIDDAYKEVSYHETRKTFERSIYKVRCNELKQRLWHCEQYAQSHVTEGIYREDEMLYTDESPIKEWTVALSKDFFIQSGYDGDQLYRLTNSIGRDILNRYAYVWLECVSRMNVRTKKWDPIHFSKYIQRSVKKDKHQYVLVSIDSPFDSFVYRYPPGIAHHSLSRHLLELCATTKLFRENYQVAYLIRKDDLPTLQYEKGFDHADCVIEDESSRKEGLMRVRLTVNPHLVMRYNKHAYVLRILCKKISV